VKKKAAVSDDWIKNWQASIAVKITAAVLYAIVTVGVALTVISLRNVKKNLQESYVANADRIAYQLGSLVDKNPGLSPGDIENKGRQIMADFDLQAVDITLGGRKISLGSQDPDSYVLDRTANTSANHSREHTINLKIYYPPLEKTITQIRHRWFVITGLVTLVSGFFLVWVIRIFITRPFATLINATIAVSAGNIDTRISVSRKDEFGDLSSFFNKMLDQISVELAARKEAEERYSDLFENANDLIQSVDINGKFLYVNRKWREVLGYTKEEIKNLTLMDVVCKDQRDHCKALLNNIVADEAGKQVETVFISKNGKEVMVEGSISVHSKEGKVIATRGIFRDITERKQSESFIRDILDNIGEGLIVIDRDFRILTANPAYCKQIKMSDREVKGRHCYEVSHHIVKPCFESGEDCPVKHTFETGAPHISLHTHTDKEGISSYIETKSYPIKNSSGQIMSVIEILNNVTEKKQLESQLRHAQKMDAIGTLTGGIAHDFNNMLTAILGFGSMALVHLEDKHPAKAYMKEVIASGERAANLTKSLLSFSRKQIADLKVTDLNDIVINVNKMLSRLIGEDINFIARLSDDKMLVMVDSGQIEQVLINLITNARAAMPDGGTVTISTGLNKLDADYIATHGFGVRGMYALISVKDTGVGMDKETQRKIFEPFFTTKMLGEGTGLGLSIAYGIIKQHKGFITVCSNLGEGTTFDILLPLVEKTVIEDQKTEFLSVLKGGTETILIAEDDDAVRTLTTSVLENMGYRVIIAIDGEDAITKFIENRDSIHLVILDLLMPKKNGREVYDLIRKTNPDIKTLFVSGYSANIINRKELLEEGINFIQKPIRPNNFLTRVREILDK
jgi:PAS domain S-box-containing protein